ARHRSRPGHLQAPRRRPRRPRLGAVQAGPGLDLPDHPARQRPRGHPPAAAARRGQRMNDARPAPPPPSVKKVLAQGRARVLVGCVLLALIFAVLLPSLFRWVLHLSADEAAYTRNAFLAGVPLDVV